MQNTQILIIEDNPDVAGVLGDYLESQGAQVDYASNGELGLRLATEGHFDAIILDLMLPKMDGYAVARALREQGASVPILMLTALDDKQDLLQGFHSGADDYLTKPFDFDELTVRLQALIKRQQGRVAQGCKQCGPLTLNIAEHTAFREGKKLQLTPSGYQILQLLISRAPNVVKREEIVQHLWGEEPPNSDILRSHMYQLRNQVDKPFDTPIILTVPKIGFRLDVKQ
ncbi:MULTISPECIES: response regulator transcription factor [Shewanella]|uniref:Response regulator transcription factor n=1 Tax=Shewanella marisflavi TaxID=260364 RepID=A0ABX5WQ13_9GAMM|nr:MULTISPECIES: response regulator transcription factor [Shewanella]QDF76605.1 response regulator transcription factor [Shewanella marisflavi]